MTTTNQQKNYLHLIGRTLQEKHNYKNKVKVTGFRKKGKKIYLQLQFKDRRRWQLEDTVATHWDVA